MTHSDELVERVARAIWDNDNSPEHPWSDEDESTKRIYRSNARAALSALPSHELLREALEALTEIGRSDIGGLQGINEAHTFDREDYSPEEAYNRLQAWRDEEVKYLMGRISARQARARATAEKLRAELGDK